MSDNAPTQKSRRDRANIRVAVIVGLIAFGIYVGYFLLNFVN